MTQYLVEVAQGPGSPEFRDLGVLDSDAISEWLYLTVWEGQLPATIRFRPLPHRRRAQRRQQDRRKQEEKGGEHVIAGQKGGTRTVT